MAKKPKTDMVRVGSADLTRPSYMEGDERIGTEELAQYVSPPRIKIVQSLSKALLEQFCLGDCVIVPNGIMLSEMGRDDKGKPTGESKGFTFIPLYFYVEWCTWNPVGMVPSIIARTLHRDHPIALKAQNSNLRTETLTDGTTVRHVEHLNFVISIENSIVTDPVILSFSRSEHRSGRQLCNLVRMRKAPIFGCRFAANIAGRENDQGAWWGLDITNPESDPWVNADSFEGMKAAHLELKVLADESKIRAQYDGDDLPGSEAASEGETVGSDKF